MILKNRVGTFALALVIIMLAILPRLAEARDIYVRLSAASSFNIASDGDMTLTDAHNTKASLGKSATLALNNGKVVHGKKSFALPVRITTAGGNLLRFNSRRYRGAFMITNKGLLNVLDLEQYLCGVLPAESSVTWPMEALRAQAIISRTYALKQSLSRNSRGYDVVDTVADQVYKGAGVETDNTNRAVSSTVGEVIAYGRELAFTPFHSDSGGHTANNEHVWGAIVPYLTGVPEPVAYTSPSSSWTAKIPRSKIEAALAKSNASVGTLKEIRVSQVDNAGRAVTLTFTGSKGSRSIKASTFRTNVGASLLKSTMFVNALGAAPAPLGAANTARTALAPSAAANRTVPSSTNNSAIAPDTGALTIQQEDMLSQLTAKGVFTTKELIDMLSNPDKKRYYLNIGIQRYGGKASELQSPRLPAPTVPVRPAPPVGAPATSMSASSNTAASGGFTIAREGDNFVFNGKGFGHGVGLSQWGSLAMAKAGWSAEKILTYYYPRTEIKRFK